MSVEDTPLTYIQFYGIIEGVSSRDTFNVNSIFFLTFMIDMKNIKGVSSRNIFQSNKKCRRFEIIFQSTTF